MKTKRFPFIVLLLFFLSLTFKSFGHTINNIKPRKNQTHHTDQYTKKQAQTHKTKHQWFIKMIVKKMEKRARKQKKKLSSLSTKTKRTYRTQRKHGFLDNFFKKVFLFFFKVLLMAVLAVLAVIALGALLGGIGWLIFAAFGATGSVTFWGAVGIGAGIACAVLYLIFQLKR